MKWHSAFIGILTLIAVAGCVSASASPPTGSGATSTGGAAVTVNMTNSNEFLWGITPVFAHVTVVPRATVIAAGWNSLDFVILTMTVAPPRGGRSGACWRLRRSARTPGDGEQCKYADEGVTPFHVLVPLCV